MDAKPHPMRTCGTPEAAGVPLGALSDRPADWFYYLYRTKALIGRAGAVGKTSHGTARKGAVEHITKGWGEKWRQAQ